MELSRKKEEMQLKNILIGGAWPYANSDMHLGHIAGLIAGSKRNCRILS